MLASLVLDLSSSDLFIGTNRENVTQMFVMFDSELIK